MQPQFWDSIEVYREDSMPYISQEDRSQVDSEIDALFGKIQMFRPDKRDGVFNYVVTRLIIRAFGPCNYSNIVRIAGNLNCILLEFYRRVAAPYEDLKKDENGEVFEL